MHGESRRLAGESATRIIRGLAERQHGVVARRQLLEAGLGRGLIQERVRGGRLLIVHRGVYAVGHRRSDLKQRWMAAVLACGPRAALARRSAAHLWDMRGWRGPVEVIRTSAATCRNGIRAIQLQIEPSDVTEEEGIPVTTRERTLLDVSAVLDTDQLRRALAAAERVGGLRWNELRRLIETERGRRGMERFRKVVSEADPRGAETRSGLEVDFLALCAGVGLPAPAVNVFVADRLVDFYWPESRLVVELDTYRFHQGAHAFERDHEGTLALEAAGMTVKRVTERMLVDRPRDVVAQLRPAFAARNRDSP